MVKGGCADVATGKKADFDADFIRLLPVVRSHASRPIRGVLS